jgi:uncharacterized membrane protein YhaH (DUF805 family)
MSLTPTKSVNVNLNIQYNKYLIWLAKILFYVCVLNVFTKVLAIVSKKLGFDLNYVCLFVLLFLFAASGQINQLLI